MAAVNRVDWDLHQMHYHPPFRTVPFLGPDPERGRHHENCPLLLVTLQKILQRSICGEGCTHRCPQQRTPPLPLFVRFSRPAHPKIHAKIDDDKTLSTSQQTPPVPKFFSRPSRRFCASSRRRSSTASTCRNLEIANALV